MSQVLPPEVPPELWRPARSMMQRFARPIEAFLSIQAASGILLLIAAGIALLWANSPWRESYHALWHLPVRFGLATFQFEQSLHFVVNEGLMVIRSEEHTSELQSRENLVCRLLLEKKKG